MPSVASIVTWAFSTGWLLTSTTLPFTCPVCARAGDTTTARPRTSRLGINARRINALIANLRATRNRNRGWDPRVIGNLFSLHEQVSDLSLVGPALPPSQGFGGPAVASCGVWAAGRTRRPFPGPGRRSLLMIKPGGAQWESRGTGRTRGHA